MDSEIAGLVGAGIGAVAGMSGTLLAQALQSRREHRKWVLTKKEEAYSNALRHLLKTLNTRSYLTADGIAILGINEMPNWFSDLSEAQSWITSLTIYSSNKTRLSINNVASRFNATMSKLMGHGVLITSTHRDASPGYLEISDNGLSSLAEMVAFAYTELLKCAQIELGKHINQI